MLGWIDSVQRVLPQTSLNIIVMDNGSDGSIAKAVKKKSGVQYIDCGKNTGFASAANEAVRLCNGTHVLLCNPDIEFNNNSMEHLFEHAKEFPERMALSPLLCDRDGTVKQNVFAYPSPVTDLARFLGLDHMFRRLAPWKHPEKARPLYRAWAQAACWLVNRKGFLDIGGFDESFFLYFEDMDFCRRASIVQKPVWIIPDARIIHYGADSSDRVKEFAFTQFYKSLMRYYEKHMPVWYFQVLRRIWPVLARIRILFERDHSRSVGLRVFIDPLPRSNPGEEKPATDK